MIQRSVPVDQKSVFIIQRSVPLLNQNELYIPLTWYIARKNRGDTSHNDTYHVTSKEWIFGGLYHYLHTILHIVTTFSDFLVKVFTG
jgi:hypothetical protein